MVALVSLLLVYFPAGMALGQPENLGEVCVESIDDIFGIMRLSVVAHSADTFQLVGKKWTPGDRYMPVHGSAVLNKNNILMMTLHGSAIAYLDSSTFSLEVDLSKVPVLGVYRVVATTLLIPDGLSGPFLDTKTFNGHFQFCQSP